MLKTLDVLFGVGVVMLMLSLAVTALTQLVTGLINARGRHLAGGVADLLRQIDPSLDRRVAKAIAAKVLTHPLVRDAAGRYGSVIHRDELAELLLELAAGNGPARLKEGVRQALANALGTGEVADKLNRWFDQTMDRVSGRFTLSARVVTVAGAALVAFGLPLDSVDLINRLWTEAPLGEALLPFAEQWLSEPWSPARLPGILLSTVLLSLGATFLYAALKGVAGLRPALAAREDEQRRERQKTA